MKRAAMLLMAFLAGCAADRATRIQGTGERVSPPNGWTDFCHRHPDDGGVSVRRHHPDDVDCAPWFTPREGHST